ncbi:filamentous hemagglutinin N-terminal domain-containing protein [Nostoc sp. PCC 7107]|uniref:beta strand repeat-containing protein n=1 Tax=Nostoc sp. PCC 7107 TaxID=317936 RepID=UPI00029ED7B3|nr:filamentous hemagglutinin N-terminal domain-containing protein [Nostoc sp. PCC 7107]AFY44913.1 filamentous hemagglutinin family outer membrane protein [Nostoc sp. PCC 7107]
MREKTIKITQSYYLSKLKLILALSSAIITTSANNVLAQNITIDGTLSPAQTLNGPIYIIPQLVGQTVGSNLFHSFGSFSLDSREIANFQSGSDIRNIFSRVTGGSPSFINGLIFTQSASVNLFFVNPSGIIFGPNARLDVGGSTRGSFVATTADALVWSNGSQFSATNPGGTSSLLTIVGDPSGFLSVQRPQSIFAIGSTLNVYQGQSLLLLGGDIGLFNSRLLVNGIEGGRIELGATAAESGTIELTTKNNILSLDFPQDSLRADVLLTNGSSLDVSAGNGGSIAINAKNIDILEQSNLAAGIAPGLGDVNSQAGDVTLNATGVIRVSDQSMIINYTDLFATGNAGNINIITDNLHLTNNAVITNRTFGQGNAGNLIIKANQSISLDNTSVIGNTVDVRAAGNGGDISITTSSLSLSNNSGVITFSSGRGNAGNLMINVNENISLDNARIASGIEAGAVGQGGDISISTGSLSLNNNAGIGAFFEDGNGNAGNITINARKDIFLDSQSSIESTTILAGNSGDVRISTGSLLLTNTASISAATFGTGNAGNVIIDARESIFLDSQSRIASSVQELARGQGGDIKITTNSLSLSNSAALFTTTLGQGNSGKINIATNSLDITNNAIISSITLGQGNAGNIIINAREGISLDGGFILSAVNTESVGQGGDIGIITESLSLTNNAILSSSTLGQGNAGNLMINAHGFVLFDRSNISSSALDTAVGDGGDISITTGSFSISNGTQLFASTLGRGDAGNIYISASEAVNISGTDANKRFSSGLFTSTSTGKGGDIVVNTNLFRLSDSAVLDARTVNEGNGGNITVNANSLEVLNGGQLITTTLGRGNAGKITVNATEKVIVNGNDASFNDRVAQFSGNVANVDAASGLFVRSDGLGSAGDIEVNSPFVLLDNGGRFIAESRSVNGGDISVNAGNALLLRRGSQISTTAGTAQAGGNGGNININAGFVIALPNENSNITANAFSGTGGQVQINTQGIFGIEPRLNDSINSSDITASSTTGINGEIIINTPNVDPTQGLTNLPGDIVNTASLVDSGCTAFGDKTGSQFTVTGRGGLPTSPDDVLNGDAVWSDTRLTVAAKPQNGSTSRVNTPQKSSNAIAIVPATGWVFNNKGEVTLVSQVAKANAFNFDSNHVACVKP